MKWHRRRLFNALFIQDFNGDNVISREDIEMVVQKLCGNNSFTDDDLSSIVQYVLKEAEGRDENAIGPQEFRNIMSRSPDFGLNFTIRF